jgi:hypothetical protein
MPYEQGPAVVCADRVRQLLRGSRSRLFTSGRRRPRLTFVLAAYAAQQAGFSWNPIKWGEGLLGYAAGVGKSVYNFVTQAIETAVNLVENDIASAADFAATIIEDVKSWAVQGFNDIEGYLEAIYRDLVADIDTAADYAANIAEGILARAESLFNTAIGTAESLYNKAVQYAEQGLAYVENLAEALANNALKAAESFANTVWNNGIKQFYDSMIAPILADAKQALSWAGTMWKWFETGVVDFWDILVKATDWIVYFAEHPFSLFEQEFNAVIDWAKQGPSAFESGALANVSRIESALTDWLGDI